MKTDQSLYPDFIVIDIDSKRTDVLNILFTRFCIETDLRLAILSQLIDIVLLGDPVKTIVQLSEDILVNINPVGGVDYDDYYGITDCLRKLYDCTKSSFDNLGIMINGIPPYEFHSYLQPSSLVIRRAKNIDH